MNYPSYPEPSRATDYGEARQAYVGQLNAHHTATPPPSSVLNAQLSHLFELRDMVAGAIDHVRGIADGLLGAQPSPLAKETAGKSPVDPPLTARITDALDGVHALLTELHNQINRLDRL